MRHVARDGHDQILGPVAALVVTVHLRPGQRGDRLDRAEDGPAEWDVAVQRGGELVEDQIGRVVVTHRDLFQHDAALDVDVLRGDRRRAGRRRK